MSKRLFLCKCILSVLLLKPLKGGLPPFPVEITSSQENNLPTASSQENQEPPSYSLLPPSGNSTPPQEEYTPSSAPPSYATLFPPRSLRRRIVTLVRTLGIMWRMPGAGITSRE